MNKLIIETLKPLKIPIHFRNYSGKEDTYITFFTYLEQEEEFADNETILTGHYIHIDVFSKGNYNEIIKQAEKLLKANGFIKQRHFDAPYEKDTGFYHKILRYLYEEE